MMSHLTEYVPAHQEVDYHRDCEGRIQKLGINQVIFRLKLLFGFLKITARINFEIKFYCLANLALVADIQRSVGCSSCGYFSWG